MEERSEPSSAPVPGHSARTPDKLRVLLASGFFERELISFREYAYSKELAALGHEVTLMCGDQSCIWRLSRVKLPVTNPTRHDAEFARTTGVKVRRRHVFLRMSDCVLYLPSLRDIRQADVVHVIEFRQGVTVLIALLARALGKPIVYDHEQRGDRSAHWYNRIDSLFRRLLIFTGALTVDRTRHTVLANRDHFQSCTWRSVPMMFAPLGVDAQRFYFDEEERRHTRAELGIDAGAPVAVMSGKLHRHKRVLDVVHACRRAGVRLIMVGTMAEDLRQDMDRLTSGTEIMLPQAAPARLRAIYNAADYAIFTTFSVSYWEAHATGVHLIVPATAFTELIFADRPEATRFGDPAMFQVSDEQYRPGVTIDGPIEEALRRPRPATPRRSREDFSARITGQRLADLYQELLDEKKAAGAPGADPPDRKLRSSRA